LNNPPLVDVIIPVHSKTRPIDRAVGSILLHTLADVRVIVVAHNISVELIRANLKDFANDPRLCLLHLEDGIHSPAGPMNFGLDHATATFVSVMGSDDEFAPGAIDSWLRIQQDGNADFVIAQIRNVGGSLVLSPPARPGRSLNLDAVKDRLSYRSAPLGLLSRDSFPHLRFSERLLSGEDLPFVSEIWFTASNIAFDRSGPEYLVHADAIDRVTSEPRPVKDDFAFLELIFEAKWVQNLKKSEKQAIGIKLIRMHLFDAIVNRSKNGMTEAEKSDLSQVARRISKWSLGSEKYLSVIDRKVFNGIVFGNSSIEEMMLLIEKRWNYRSLDVLATKNPLYFFHRQGPLRTYMGGYFI
jgi:glycosyltransferase involved in cell wall biosynthesis